VPRRCFSESLQAGRRSRPSVKAILARLIIRHELRCSCHACIVLSFGIGWSHRAEV
jgi:hypothetical protein